MYADAGDDDDDDADAAMEGGRVDDLLSWDGNDTNRLLWMTAASCCNDAGFDTVRILVPSFAGVKTTIRLLQCTKEVNRHCTLTQFKKNERR